MSNKFEELLSIALNARLRRISLMLAPDEVEILCQVLEENVSLRLKLSRKGRAGVKPQGERALTNAERQRRKYLKKKGLLT